jgi:OmpA-OmpF porin, OOP family
MAVKLWQQKRRTMMIHTRPRTVASLGTVSFIALAVFSAVSLAQDVKIEGLIKGRSGATLMVQTSDDPLVNVVMDDNTKVEQNVGALKARKKQMSMAALIPGLQIKVEGTYDANKMLAAKKITFNGNDLERAQSIQAGLAETEAQTKQNAEASAKHQAELEKQNAALQAQNAALQQQQAQLKEQNEKIAANKALIAANTARFGQLDDYYIYDEVTVLFGNGKTKVDPKYNSQLTTLATKAESVQGYMIQVKGYASASGSAAMNQKLSEQRAGNVTQILQQQGRVPLSRMLAPGAMGESRANESAKGEDQAADRKVVVRVLQNKGIAGIQ